MKKWIPLTFIGVLTIVAVITPFCWPKPSSSGCDGTQVGSADTTMIRGLKDSIGIFKHVIDSMVKEIRQGNQEGPVIMPPDESANGDGGAKDCPTITPQPACFPAASTGGSAKKIIVYGLELGIDPNDPLLPIRKLFISELAKTACTLHERNEDVVFCISSITLTRPQRIRTVSEKKVKGMYFSFKPGVDSNNWIVTIEGVVANIPPHKQPLTVSSNNLSSDQKTNLLAIIRGIQ